MRVCENGVMRDATAEELSAMKAARVRDQLAENARPMTPEEVFRLMITRQINSLEIDGNTALRMRQFYPTFDSAVGQTVEQGFKFTNGDKLWRVIQPELTIQSHYPPGTGTESLYEEICETHAGIEEDPIPYDGNMALEDGRYYVQGDVIYRCIRDTINPVYHALADLVVNYVEEV